MQGKQFIYEENTRLHKLKIFHFYEKAAPWIENPNVASENLVQADSKLNV